MMICWPFSTRLDGVRHEHGNIVLECAVVKDTGKVVLNVAAQARKL